MAAITSLSAIPVRGRAAPMSSALGGGQRCCISVARGHAMRFGAALARPARPGMAVQRRRFAHVVRAEGGEASPTEVSPEAPAQEPEAGKGPRKGPVQGTSKGVNLFDPAATISRAVTRRFGIVGGLGFVALLASTEGYEIVKALLEVDKDVVDGEVIELPSGLKYRDIKIGGGPSPKKGDFVGANVVVQDGETLLLDTRLGRPVAFTFGKPAFGVVCPGLVEGVSTMRRGGSRELLIPAELAWGEKGTTLPNGAVVEPGMDIKMIVTIVDVTGGYL